MLEFSAEIFSLPGAASHGINARSRGAQAQRWAVVQGEAVTEQQLLVALGWGEVVPG